MKIYQHKTIQRIPISIEKAWDFFSSPKNLDQITPNDMGFKILSISGGDKMYEGQIIHYKVAPVAKIPIRWTTEITHVTEGDYFVDEQRFGPYAMWHHEHHFKQIDGGVEMIDHVHYAIPFGYIGRIANSIFVKSKLKEIFDFRYKKVEELFGSI